jgi:hypothetical protein
MTFPERLSSPEPARSLDPMSLRERLFISKPHPVPIPDLEGGAFLRPLSVAGLSRFLAAQATLDPAAQLSLLVGLTASDETGALLFVDDPEAAADLPFATVKLLADAALEANGLAEGTAKNP